MGTRNFASRAGRFRQETETRLAGSSPYIYIGALRPSVLGVVRHDVTYVAHHLKVSWLCRHTRISRFRGFFPNPWHYLPQGATPSDRKSRGPSRAGLHNDGTTLGDAGYQSILDKDIQPI